MTHVAGSFCSDLSFDATTSKSTAIVCTLSFVLTYPNPSIPAVEFDQSATVRLDFCLKFLLQGVCAYRCIHSGRRETSQQHNQTMELRSEFKEHDRQSKIPVNSVWGFPVIQAAVLMIFQLKHARILAVWQLFVYLNTPYLLQVTQHSITHSTLGATYVICVICNCGKLSWVMLTMCRFCSPKDARKKKEKSLPVSF